MIFVYYKPGYDRDIINESFRLEITSKLSPKMLSYKKTQLVHIEHQDGVNLFKFLLLFNLILILLWYSAYKIILSHDIQLNPGPLTDIPDTNSLSSTTTDFGYFKNISIVHMNIQSLKPKIDLLIAEMQTYDILVFTETWLDVSTPSKDIAIPNFNDPIRNDRHGRIGGGVAIYVRRGISYLPKFDLVVADSESIWVEINSLGKKFIIGGVYVPPSTRIEGWNIIFESFERLYNAGLDFYAMGDYNNDLLKSQNCKVKDLINMYNLTQLISEPTNFTENSSSLLDLILCKNVDSVITSGVADPFIPDLIRYHCPIYLILDLQKPKPHNFCRTVWQYDAGRYDDYRDNLNSVNWNTILSSNSVDVIADEISKTIIDLARKNIPHKIIRVRQNDAPWMHNEIRKLIRKRKRIHKRAKASNNDQNIWEQYRKTRNEVVSAIRKAKNNYYNKLAGLADKNVKNSKLWWKISKQLLNNTKKSEYPALNSNGSLIENDYEKAQLFNDYFASQSDIDDKEATLPDYCITDNTLPRILD